jgi:CRP-like cAMP-binding protein
MQTNWHEMMEQSILADFLSPSNLKQVVSCAEIVDLQAGEYLFREGQENCKVFVVHNGQVDLTMTVPGRGPTRILTLGPNDIVAWSAVLGAGVMTSSAECTEPTRLIAIDGKSTLNTIESDPKFGCEFMRMMATALAKRLLATRLQMLDLFAQNS